MGIDGVVCALCGFGVGIHFCIIVYCILHGRSEEQPERKADFFDPVQYPTMDAVEARRIAREYTEQIIAEN
jgi:hypothetical protein